MEPEQRIPKRIYLSWPDASVMDSDHFFAALSFRALKRLNPDWSVEIFDDDQIDEELKHGLDSSDYLALADRHVVEKIDTWRLLKLYTVGGVYIDADRIHDTPLSETITDSTMWLLPTCREFDFTHDILATAPENPAFLLALKLNLQRRKQGYNSTYFLGSQTFMHACTQSIVGEMVNVDPGIKIFEALRAKVSEAGFISTFREDPPMYTCTFRNKICMDKDSYEAYKKDFYIQYGIGHWTGVW